MKCILITGGQAAGKSTEAEKIALEYKKCVYVATAKNIDKEIDDKIFKHILNRKNKFITIEEETNLIKAFEIAIIHNAHSIIVDCITMWVNNILFYNEFVIENEIENLINYINNVMKKNQNLQKLIFVTNEVGQGIIPSTKIGRNYVEKLGYVNKCLARQVDFVYLMVSGIKLKIK